VKEDDLQMNLPNLPCIVQLTLLLSSPRLLFRKSIPKPQSLVTRARYDSLTIGTHCEIQHTVGMTRQRRDHVERWVFPDADLVLSSGGGESVSGDKFV
jgi:hypothetical protein